MRTLGALVAVMLAASLALLVGQADSSEGLGGIGESGAEAIGPLSGTAIPSYIESRQSALTTAAGDVLAAVSFVRYADERTARRAVGDLEVKLLLVAAPAGRPETIEGDVGGWIDDARKEAAVERKGLEGLLRTTEDPDFQVQFRSDINRLRRLEKSLVDGGPVVFGVLVKGPAIRLRQLAKAPGVRLVDIGGDRRPSDDHVRGIRPEETTRGESRSRDPVRSTTSQPSPCPGLGRPCRRG